MRLAGRRVLLVAAPVGFRDEELLVPRQALERLGAQVTVASTRTGQIVGLLGARLLATASLDRVRLEAFDALLVAGGDGAATYLWGHEGLLALVRRAHAAGQVVAAICLAPVVLARAGLVTGGEVAVYRSPEALAELERLEVRPSASAVLVSGRIITANGPEAAAAWTEAIAAALAAKP